MKARITGIYLVIIGYLFGPVYAQTIPNIRSASNFALFSSIGTVSNVGASQITGNIGANTGTSLGFGNIDGQVHNGDSVSQKCSIDLDTAYNQLDALPCDSFLLTLLANHYTFRPGVYCVTLAAILSDTIILNARGNPNAIFVFNIAGAVTFLPNTKILLANGAQACRVFWKVDGLVTIGTNCSFKGNVIGLSSITAGLNTQIEGRLLTQLGSISISTVTARIPLGCGVPVLVGPPSPNLKHANCFALYSSSGSLSNSNTTVITGAIGSDSGVVTGFQAANISQGIQINNTLTHQVKADLDSAKKYIQGLPYDIDILFPASFGNKLTLTPHVYRLNANTTLSDTLYLNAQGYGNAVFVLKVNGTFSTAINSRIILQNGAKSCNIFWLISSTTDINDQSFFVGSLIASNNINLDTGSVFDGRMLTTSGSISSNKLTAAIPTGCGGCPYSTVNNPPFAVDDSLTISEDASQISIAVQNNDNDPDLDPMTTGILSAAKNGTSILNGNLIDYKPNLNYYGYDTITYTVCDNRSPSLCDAAFVLIRVLPVNDKPIAADDTASTTVNTQLTVDVIANDYDPDGDNLIVGIITPPQQGTTTINSNSISYTPGTGYIGFDTMYYRICDTGAPSLCDTARLVIRVISGSANQAPVAINDSATTYVNIPVLINVTANDSDPDGNALTVSIATNPVNGTATLSGNNIRYTPNLLFIGRDTLYYRICDNGIPSLCDIARVVINVRSILANNAPIANNDSAFTFINTPVTIPVTANDFDPDGDSLILSIISLPSNGTAVIAGKDIKYTPNISFTGFDTLYYRICDNAINSLCDDARLVIEVGFNLSNHPPIAVDDYYNILMNTPSNLDVTSNDYDPDGDPLMISILKAPVHGTAIVNGNMVNYSPNTGFTGFDTLFYRVCDNGLPYWCDSARVVIHVRTPGANNPPVAINDFVTIPKNATFKIIVKANDTDPDGDPLRVSIESYPQNGIAVTDAEFIFYTPDFNFIGNDTLYYRICDDGIPNLCDTAMVGIRIVDDNPPIAMDDQITLCENSGDTSIYVQQNDFDPDGDSLNTSIAVLPKHGTATINVKAIIYKPTTNYNGRDTLMYRVCDSLFCDSAFIFITINPKPAAFVGPDQEIEEGGSVVIGGAAIAGNKYLWIPASGLSSNTLSNPVASPVITTTYVLTETIIATNCSNSNSVQVRILDDAFFNGFSPNGDGKNDYWRIPFLSKYPINTVTIINRLGTEVWKNNNYDNLNIRFTGQNMNGTDLPDGTYFYIIKFNNEEKSGWVIIER